MYNINCRFPIIRYFFVEIIYCFIFHIGVLYNAVLVSAVQWSAVQSAIQFSSVVQSCLALCDTMDCSMPGFAVLHHFPGLAQTHELVMPFNLLNPLHSLHFWFQSFPASSSFPVSQIFTSGGQSIGAPASTSVLPMDIQDWFSLGWKWIFRIDFL